MLEPTLGGVNGDLPLEYRSTRYEVGKELSVFSISPWAANANATVPVASEITCFAFLLLLGGHLMPTARTLSPSPVSLPTTHVPTAACVNGFGGPDPTETPPLPEIRRVWTNHSDPTRARQTQTPLFSPGFLAACFSAMENVSLAWPQRPTTRSGNSAATIPQRTKYACLCG